MSVPSRWGRSAHNLSQAGLPRRVDRVYNPDRHDQDLGGRPVFRVKVLCESGNLSTDKDEKRELGGPYSLYRTALFLSTACALALSVPRYDRAP